MAQRGVVGFVTDGAVRDLVGVEQEGLPVWCAAATAPPSIGRLHFADWQLPVGCGGVAVVPGDFVVADRDGVVVVPASVAAEIAGAAQDQNRFERFVLEKVAEGHPVKGLYPPNEATLAEYERWDGE